MGLLFAWAASGNAGPSVAAKGDALRGGIQAADEPLCLPTPDGSGCLPVECPDPLEVCQPRCINFDPLTGLQMVTDCDCGLPEDCHLEFVRPPGPSCLLPDNGAGTVDLPPFGCSYIGDRPWLIEDGLPVGTTLELIGELGDFGCDQPPAGCSLGTIPQVCEAVGGSLGGNGHCFHATLEFSITGTGELAGYARTILLPVWGEVFTGPRIPGDPVQPMDALYNRLEGELFGDPDFDVLRVTWGNDLGLDSPGAITLRRLPSGDFAVDSFFDITYRIEFTGAPGSALEGYQGTTVRGLRLYTGGSGVECVGDCPPGAVCEQQVTVLPDGTLDMCCLCAPPDPDLKWSQDPAPSLPGLHSHDYDSGNGLQQITIADDWLCQGGQVTDMHWWGNYELGPLGIELRRAGIQFFHIGIHEPDGQNACLPGPELWSTNVPFAAVGETPTGLVNLEGANVYRYGFILEEPFDQEEGLSYFLSIHAVSVMPLSPASWRWQEHQRAPAPMLCGAAEQHVPAGSWQTIEWPGNPILFSDMAFEITSHVVPQPPVADANGPYSGSEGTPVTFDASGSYDLDGTIVLYEWDVDLDGVYDVAQSTPAASWTWNDDTNTSVGLRVTDDQGLTDTDATSVVVQNADPVLAGVAATSIDENQYTTLTGSMSDPGADDSFTLKVDWGDGTPVVNYPYPAGTTTFMNFYQYLDDDPTGTAADDYTIDVTLQDDDLGTTSTVTMITVRNAPPFISGPSVTPTVEGGTSTLTGTFSDPGLLDTFILTVDWGDTNVENFPYPPGSTSFLETHPYGPSGNYVVSIHLADDDLGSSQGFLPLTVSNVPPTADANGPYTGRVGEPIQLDGTGSTDPGNDIVLFEWDLDSNGVFDDASGPEPLFAPWWVGPRTIGLKVTDDDGAFDTVTATVIGEPPIPCPKWVQEPDCTFGLDVGSWYTEPTPTGSAPTVADDWLCDGRPLVGIQWWGSYIGYLADLPDPAAPPPGGPDRPTGFRLSWYTDMPATPGSHSHPEMLIDERYVLLADYGPTHPIPGAIIEEAACLVNLDWIAPGLVEHVYRYTYWVLPGEEFNEKADTVYWLSIEARYDSLLPPPAWRWGWSTTDPRWNWNDDAVFQTGPAVWDEMVYPPPGWEHVPEHPYEGQSVNQAFVLLTDVCPARCIKWGQPPDMIEGLNMLSSRIDGGAGPIRADDFVSDGRVITDIHWWGSYLGWRSNTPVYRFPPTGPDHPLAFELRWHAEDPGDPSLPQPAPLLGSVWVDIDRCHEIYYGTVDQSVWNPNAPFEHEFQYYVDLLDPRIRDAVPWPELEGGHYWLSVQAVFPTNWVPDSAHGGWGWKTTPAVQPHPAVQSPDGMTWQPDTYPPGHPRADNPFDLAFELTTTNLPSHEIRLLSLDPSEMVTLVSSGYCGCGVQVLEHAGLALTNGWSVIEINFVPRQTNVWVVPQLNLTNRFFRINAREE